MAAKKNLSVEEILAACRQADGEAGGAPAPVADSAPAESAPPPPAAKPAAASKPPGSMSVEEMLAAARGEKAGGAKPAAAAAESAPAEATPSAPAKAAKDMSVAEMLAAARGQTAKPKAGAAKPAAARPAAKPAAASKAPAGAVHTGPRDTSSILAAARKADKRGPMSKAEAKEKGVEPPKKAKPMPVMPEKPAYVKAAAAAPSGDEDRRGFMAMFFGSFLALGFTLMGLVSGFAGLGLARYLFPNILTEPPSQFKVGFPADFPPDAVVTKFKAQFGVWVVNSEYEGQRQITALKSVCTHLGCTPNWLEGEQKFKCPCHGSGFYKDGINFEGPAPRPLERYAIKIADDGQVEIDKSKTYQQEMGAWKDSTSYIPV